MLVVLHDTVSMLLKCFYMHRHCNVSDVIFVVLEIKIPHVILAAQWIVFKLKVNSININMIYGFVLHLSVILSQGGLKKDISPLNLYYKIWHDHYRLIFRSHNVPVKSKSKISTINIIVAKATNDQLLWSNPFALQVTYSISTYCLLATLLKLS